jgi:Na+/proline symporter
MAHPSSLQDDDRLSRKRRHAVIVLAVLVIGLNNGAQILAENVSAFAFVPSLTDTGWNFTHVTMLQILLVISVAFWIAAFCLLWFVAGRRGPAAMNDELTLAHRSTALRAGCWCFLAAVAVVYARVHSGIEPFGLASVEHLLETIASVGVVIPAVVFEFLERKAERVA